MKSLVKWLVVFAVLVGGFILFTQWKERRDQREERRARIEREAQAAEEAQRAALIAGQPPAPTVGVRPLQSSDPRVEQRFRQLAGQHRVEVIDYSSLGSREVVVQLRARGHVAMGDLLDSCIREGILLDFDHEMMGRNDMLTVDPNSGARIHETRFTMRVP